MSDPEESRPRGEAATGPLEPDLGDEGPTGPVGASESAASGPPFFEEGDVLAERFRVVRFIARGGMGEVYEAEDRELGERVALKTIRSDVARDGRATERFRREILLSRRVTHPNACRIFDVFRHRREDGAGVTFLTMELLPGESLADRIRSAGRLGAAESLPIALQVSAALDAAHRAGIVHRDLKSANVLLVSAPDAPGGVRAVVTDFGLARALGGDAELSSTVTGTGFVMGTAAYMAPEQIEDGTITPATDVYALGVVLYEMVTGKLPFLGSSPLSTAVKRLTAPPPPPRLHAPDLDPRWEAAILRCLAFKPAERFGSADEVARALSGGAFTASHGGRRRRALVAAAALVAVVGGLFVLGRVRSPWPGSTSTLPHAAAPSHVRLSVAVLGFRDLSGRSDTAWLSTALTEMLSAELAAGEKMRTVPGETVARTRLELALPDAESLAADTLARLRANLGADLVALGSYLVLGGRLRLQVLLQDAALGETVATISETGAEGDLMELVARAGAQLRLSLGLGRVSEADAVLARAALPSNPAAARLYAEGLAKLRSFDALAARDLLERAVAAEPRHPLAHAALAQAWSALGFDAKAREAAGRARDLAAGLTREERLLVEGRYHEAGREWAAAAEAYRTLFGFFPDNLEYGLRLAAAQSAAGRPREALATLDALRALADDPRIDLEEAAASALLSEYRRVRAAAERAGAKGAARGARLLVAQAKVWEGWALWDLGQPRDALVAYEQARKTHAEAGDRAGLARTLRGMGTVASSLGDLAEAKRLFTESLGVYREIGHQAGAAVTLSNVGNVLHKEGDLAGARRMFEESLALRRRIGDRTGTAAPLLNIAGILFDQGDLEGARAMFDQALALKRESGEEGGVAVALNAAGEAALARGDLAPARAMHDEALRICRAIGQKRSAAYALHGLGQVDLAAGDLAAARRSHAEALAIREALGERGTAALSRLALATLDVEEGEAPSAEAAARRAAADLATGGRIAEAAEAQLVLARSLLAQGRAGEAQTALATARERLGRTENRALRLALSVGEARVRGASDREGAARALDAAAREATKDGFVGVALEARLAAIPLVAGKAAVRARADALARDARARGFGRIAGKAEDLTRGSG